MVQVKDTATGLLELYGISDSATDGRLGLETKEMYGESFVLVSGNKIVHNDVVHFSCTRDASFVIANKTIEHYDSIVPEDEKNRGLVHFYKSKSGWNFIKEDEIGMMLDRK